MSERTRTWSSWACRVAPLPWIAGAAAFRILSKRADSLGAAVCLVSCFVAVGLGVAGLFGLLHHHSQSGEEATRPPRSVMILALLGIAGGIVAAMSSVLLSDLAEG